MCPNLFRSAYGYVHPDGDDTPVKWYENESFTCGEDNDFKPLALEPMIVDKVNDNRRDNLRLVSVKLWMI